MDSITRRNITCYLVIGIIPLAGCSVESNDDPDVSLHLVNGLQSPITLRIVAIHGEEQVYDKEFKLEKSGAIKLADEFDHERLILKISVNGDQQRRYEYQSQNCENEGISISVTDHSGILVSQNTC